MLIGQNAQRCMNDLITGQVKLDDIKSFRVIFSVSELDHVCKLFDYSFLRESESVRKKVAEIATTLYREGKLEKYHFEEDRYYKPWIEAS